MGQNMKPETLVEVDYIIFCALIGVFVFAYIIGNIFNLIQIMNAGSTRFAAVPCVLVLFF